MSGSNLAEGVWISSNYCGNWYHLFIEQTFVEELVCVRYPEGYKYGTDTAYEEHKRWT